MTNRYADEMRKIEMTDERKDELVDTLASEIEAALTKTVATGSTPRKQAKRKPVGFRFAAAAAVFAVVVGLGGSAYAMDIGGIQRTVQVWIHGDQTDATLVVENGSYSLDYEDEDGNQVHREGGGVAINPDGTERPLTEEELWDEINAPEVEYEEDGRVIVYYLNQQLDVTDKFFGGVCYVQLQVEDSVFYLTIKYQNGYAWSPHGYIQPNMFN